MAASVQQRIAFGERARQKVRRIGSGFGYEGERSILTGTRCASVQGFSLHANTSIPAHRRAQLERLLRYTARGAVALERLEVNADGDLLYTFTHPWKARVRFPLGTVARAEDSRPRSGDDPTHRARSVPCRAGASTSCPWGRP